MDTCRVPAGDDAGSVDRPGPPDVAGAVVGWRTWNLGTGAEPVLRSPLQDYGWFPRQTTRARCRGAHRAPGAQCSCGLYAARDVWTAVGSGGGVLGCVTLWGVVVEGEYGWRAGCGYPCLLITGPDVPAGTRRGLAARYGVPVYSAEQGPAALVESLRVRPGDGSWLTDPAEALRRACADGPPAHHEPRDAGAVTPVERLLAVMRPGAVRHRPGVVTRALGVLCALVDGLALLAAGVVALDRPGSSGLLQFLGVLALVFGVGAAAVAGRGAVAGLRAAVRDALGGPGRVLWRVLVVPMALTVVGQVVAQWGLLAHHDPVWLPPQLAAPALVLTLGLGARPAVGSRPRSGSGRVARALAVLLTAAVLVGCCVIPWASPTGGPRWTTQLGRDLAFLNTTRQFWNPRLADDGPPGLCLAGEAGFFAADASTVVECTGPHWGELTGYAPLGPPPYPGDDEVEARAAFACGRLAAGEGLAGPEIDVDTLYPDATIRNDPAHTNDVYAACAVHRDDGRPFGPGTHVDPSRRLPDQPVTMDLHGDRPGDSAPVGTCVTTRLSGDDPALHAAPVVTCDRPHWAEVLGYPALGGPHAPWPGDDAVADAAEAACRRLAASRGLPADVVVDGEWPDRAFWDVMAPTGPTAACLAHRVGDAPVAGPWR